MTARFRSASRSRTWPSSIPTSLFAVSLTEAFTTCDRLNRRLGYDRAAWTALVERCMHPPGGSGRTVH